MTHLVEDVIRAVNELRRLRIAEREAEAAERDATGDAIREAQTRKREASIAEWEAGHRLEEAIDRLPADIIYDPEAEVGNALARLDEDRTG